MKKNVFALSIAAAVAGMTGAAHAITTVVPATSEQLSAINNQRFLAAQAKGEAAPRPLLNATDLAVSPSGVGHILLVPYYTTQSGNATLLNLVNTDTINGKAVKVRFRGAANSDDVYDFQVFLSPGDVWSANVSTGANGMASIVTADASCTKPALKTVQSFSTLRVDPALTGDALANETREGYVEIFNMGDIAPTLIAAGGGVFGTVANPLYTAIKHVANVAPCTGAAYAALDTNAIAYTGLTPPTSGLASNWIIINIGSAAAYGAAAVAVQAVDQFDLAGVGNSVYWPQTNAVFTQWPSRSVTADPLLAGDLTKIPLDPAKDVPAVLPLLQDLPDLSTPYTIAGPGLGIVRAVDQVISLSRALATVAVSNEFLVDSATLQIGAASDFVFSMPTRRYSVALNYLAPALPTFNQDLLAPEFANTNYFTQANTTVNARKVCVFNIAAAAWNQEETPEPTVIASPQPTPLLCGETSVMAINQTNPGVGNPTRVLGATVAVQGLSSAFNAGWYRISTPGLVTPGFATRGLPVLGSVFTKAAAGNSNFGVNFEHRYTRPDGL